MVRTNDGVEGAIAPQQASPAAPALSDEHTPVALVLTRLPDARRSASGWVATCPCHEDRRPSVGLTEGTDGRALLTCRAGCRTEDIVSTLGITMADLFPRRDRMQSLRRVVATYDYRDEQAELLYQVCRFEPKDFRARRPTASGWVWNLAGVRRVPYRLPDLLAVPTDGLVVVVEGERDADALAARGIVATTNVGGAGKWRAEYNEYLRGRRVCILPDNDEPGRAHARSVAESLRDAAASIAIVELPDLPPKGDVSDWLAAGGTDEALAALAAMDPFGERDGAPGLGAAGPIVKQDPRPTLAELLDGLVAHLRRFIHFALPAHADAVALWVGHTHVPLDRLEQSPILALTSAVKQSGKTKVLDVLEFLVARPWRISRPSESVLFRKIDQDHPTVLLDEVDTIFNDKSGTTEGIRAVFNSGNRRGTKVPRSVAQGKTIGLVEFDVFCPKVTAGIGGLPETILDRAIVIPMERRSRHEPLERLRERTSRRLGAPLRDALAMLVAAITDLSLADDALPPELDDRAQDGWEPLLAIADAAGGDWPRRARAAAVAIHSQRASSDDNHELRLLRDCRAVFGQVGPAFVPTADLREGLIGLEESPWGEIRGKPITPHYIGKLLDQFGIQSRRERPEAGANPVRGYLRSDFTSAWLRYVPEASGTSGTSGTPETAATRSDAVDVPDVPDVPDVLTTAGMTPQQQRALVVAAFDIFGDDLDYVVGHA